MKRILLSTCCLLISCLLQAQYCGFDQHLSRLIDNNPLVQNQLDRMDSKLATAAPLHGKAAAGANFVIPTVVYVIHSGGPENISDQQIQSQLDAMNLFFGVHGISFCLATQENGVPFTEPTPGIFRINSSLTNHQFGEDSLLMGLSTLSAADYLRIFVVANINQGSGVLGYATFPGTGGVHDGVVMRYEAFGEATTCGCNNLMPNYDQGKVMLHELGHWLNLYHTFHNGCSGNTAGDCNTQGDRVCDTPPVAIPNGGCPNAAPNSCQETPNDQPDLIDNHMDYTDDNCRSAFTPGQRARMQATLTSFRSNLVSPSNLMETGVTCTGGLSAAFESSTKSICTGQPVTFTAFMGASNYTWDLGNGVQLTGNPITHAFTNPGTVEVTLTVSDGSDTLSSTQQFYAADCSNLRLDQSTWMFGFFAAVDFTTGNATPTTRAFFASPSFASSEANVVQMDSNGNVLFSSNGANAWNDADVQISSAPLVNTSIG
ncbi:MAG: M43 family zinc metalloprotease, partial [Bacteroidota bacterium]